LCFFQLAIFVCGAYEFGLLVFDFGILAMNILFFGELAFGISSTKTPNWPSRIARHGVAKIPKTAYEGKTILFRVFGIVTKTPLPNRFRDTFFENNPFSVLLPKPWNFCV